MGFSLASTETVPKGRWFDEFVTHSRLVRPPAEHGPECQRLCDAVDAGVRKGGYPLPVLPETASEVLFLCQAPDANLDRIVGLLDGEPGITARLLSLANSPLFRGHAVFRTGREAVVRLGLRTVRDLFMQAIVMANVFRVPRFVPRMRELRAHATGVAFACRALEGVTQVKDHFAFLAGLLHDLGKPTLLYLIADTDDRAAVDAVEEILAIRHARVGAVVAERLRLPEPIVRSVARHHAFDPAQADDRLPTFVAAGELLWKAALDRTPKSRTAIADSNVARILGLPAGRVDGLIEQVAAIAGTCQAAAE